VNRDFFGNLQDWKTVLDQLDDIETRGVLAEYQRAFIRVLGFKKKLANRHAEQLIGSGRRIILNDINSTLTTCLIN
jgi:hypothetical protein